MQANNTWIDFRATLTGCSSDVEHPVANWEDGGIRTPYQPDHFMTNPAETDERRIKPFQIRWNEPLGKPECPYMYRWVFTTPWFSVRIHRWLRSDDKRYYHNHPYSFITMVLKGAYIDVSCDTSPFRNEPGILKHKVSIRPDDPKCYCDWMEAGDIRYRPASHTHYVHEPRPNTWTLVLGGPAVHKWGFWVDEKFIRPLRFFSKYGHPPCSEL